MMYTEVAHFLYAGRGDVEAAGGAEDLLLLLAWYTEVAHFLYVGRGDVGAAGGAEVGAQSLQHCREHLDEGHQLG